MESLELSHLDYELWNLLMPSYHLFELSGLLQEFNWKFFHQSPPPVELPITIYCTNCYTKDNGKGKIRAQQKTKTGGAGSWIKFKEGLGNTWDLSITRENVIWLQKKFDLMGTELDETSIGIKWQMNDLFLSREEMNILLKEQYPTRPKVNKRKRDESTLVEEPPPKRVVKTPTSESVLIKKGPNKNSFTPSNESYDTWGVDVNGALTTLSKDDGKLIFSKKQKGSMELVTNFKYEKNEYPREVREIAENTQYFSTSEGIYKNNEGYILSLSKATYCFHGVDAALGNIYYTSQNSVIYFQHNLPSLTTKHTSDSNNSLSDVTAFMCSKALVVFMLDRAEGKIRTIVFEPSRAEQFLVLEPVERSGEVLKLDRPSGITVSINKKAQTFHTLPPPPKNLQLLVCDTFGRRIVQISLGFESLVNWTATSFPCAFETVWKSEEYHPLSISSASEKEFYFSAVKNIDTSDLGHLASNNLSASDNSNSNMDADQGGNGSGPTGGNGSDEDEGNRDNGGGNECFDTAFHTKIEYYKSSIKLIALLLNHPKGGPMEKNIALKLYENYNQLPNREGSWKTITNLCDHMLEGDKLNENFRIVTVGKSATQAPPPSLGSLVKFNFETKKISCDLNDISSNEFIRPITGSGSNSIVYGTNFECGVHIAVWGKVLVRVNANTPRNFDPDVEYVIAADPSSGMGIGVIIPHTGFLSVHPNYIIGLLDKSAEPISECGHTMLVTVSLTFMPGNQITCFLRDIKTGNIQFGIEPISQNMPSVCTQKTIEGVRVFLIL